MPLYEYKCNCCGAVFETLQKFSDPPLRVHQNCGGELERLLSPPALQFKGTGWYVTDYGGKSNGKDALKPPALPDAPKDKAPKKAESATTK